VRALFSQEAIQEFQVLTNSYTAEFGKASGGVVNIVTKSGTNQLQGNAFLYHRDDSLNARSYFEDFDIFGNPVNLEKGPYRRNQWGAHTWRTDTARQDLLLRVVRADRHCSQ
jgi:outer membrane receptor protein involved in Fe transport